MGFRYIQTADQSAGSYKLAGIDDYSLADSYYEASTYNLVNNAWQFIASTHDGSATGDIIRLYYGNLTTIAALLTIGYSEDASGTLTDDSGADVRLGKGGGGGDSFTCIHGWVGMWNTRLTLEQIRAQQFTPHVTGGCVLFTHLGFDGTTSQPDWSGNANNGTITGAVVADHVPINIQLPRRRLHLPYAISAASTYKPRLTLLGVG